jgi:hypothetical protein
VIVQGLRDLIRGQIDRFVGLARMTADAVPIEDRLDLASEAEAAGRPVKGREVLRPGLQRLGRARGRAGRRVLVLVTTHARLDLARHERRPTPHRLDRAPLRVEGLEIERRARRGVKHGRAVVVNASGAEHDLDVPRAVSDGHGRGHLGTAPAALVRKAPDGRGAELQGHHAKLLDRSARNAR